MSEMLQPPDQATELVSWLENLRVDLTESLNAVALRGARPVAVGVTEGGTRNVSYASACLVGFALNNESDDETATVRVLFYDGNNSDTADCVLKVSLAPGESARDWFSDGGISLVHGLYVDYVGGTITGSVFMRGPE